MLHKIIELWHQLSFRLKANYFALIFLMLLTSFAEMINIGIFIPLLSFLTQSKNISENNFFINGLSSFLLTFFEKYGFIFLLLFFCFLIILTAFFRVILLWFSAEVSFNTGAEIAKKIYSNALYEDYSIHIQKNSGDLISTITHKTSMVISGVISGALTVLTSLFVGLAVIITLLVIDLNVTLIIFALFSILYLLNILIVRNILLKLSNVISNESTNSIKALQNGLGSIRDIIIDGSQPLFINNFSMADSKLRKAQGRSVFISQFPKYIFEAMGFLLLIGYMIYMYNGGIEFSSQLPFIALLALVAQKLLPQMQLLFSAISNIKSTNYQLDDILEALAIKTTPFKTKKPLIFNKSIELINVSFKYKTSSSWILRNLNLNIRKGEIIGIIGRSGSGKSTLVDIIMGLLVPQNGYIAIDKNKITNFRIPLWRSNISHVPQFIFLSDSTIKENIAFGVNSKEINEAKIKKALRAAQLENFVNSLPDNIETKVGERGIILSGGQRQRIGIARALYKESPILIMDEATNSLDAETSNALMRSIRKYGKLKTIIIISHEKTLLSACDTVYMVKNKSINLVNLNKI